MNAYKNADSSQNQRILQVTSQQDNTEMMLLLQYQEPSSDNDIFEQLSECNNSMFNPYPLGILARNLPESSKIHQCTFGNMPLSSKCTMHFRWSFIFSTYGLYVLPGSNFAPFEEVKVPVFQKSAPWRILMDLGWLGLISKWMISLKLLQRNV